MIKTAGLRKIEERKCAELIPYENNPRDNDKAVDAVAASIREFGFNVPIVIDKDDIIVAGHTRLKAAERLGLEDVPTIKVSDLTDEEVRAFRLADNKTAELAGWDFILLDRELKELGKVDMAAFGFNLEHDKEYQEFVDKFEMKHTTDDCFTPPNIYDAVADWVAKEYNVKRKNFVRPFKPNGDYQAENYKATDIVVDNPPFSIMSEIVEFYVERGIRFFLFAPCLALFNYLNRATGIAIQAAITYDNGAIVPTSFLTNLEDEDVAARTAPELRNALDKADAENRRKNARKIPKYDYPDEIVTAAMMGKWSRYGIAQTFRRSESKIVNALDAQKEKGKVIYGKGLLLSEKAAAEKAAAEKAAAEKAAAEKAAAEKAAAEKWTLSEREKAIVRSLGK